MKLTWPEPMPEQGRLSTGESDAAWASGVCLTVAPKLTCQQVLNITLFFDGTNNNDDEDNPWRDSKTDTHTNVARLYNAALHQPNKGVFRFYIPGVGTPFPEIGELLYSTMGKAMGEGFSPRCVWAYTRVLNAVYHSIASDKTRELIDHDEAKELCHEGANGNMQGFDRHLHRLGVAHKQAVDEHAWPRTVKKIWINVFGFSRGAAAARVFVHKLIHEWAPGGQLGGQTGKYALPYKVNFMGLFDTVASVGPPDSMRTMFNNPKIAGHSGFAGNGALAIPEQVDFCVHAISIHEQRMSFPLDSIRTGDIYSGGIRDEIAYPGVHSDVGGGYRPGEQGKGRNGDASKLSQIPLHDMYIAALKYGVPLMKAEAIQANNLVALDFALHPSTIAVFNAWLKTVDRSIDTIEGAMKFGMGQMLSWRTRRARIGTADYVTERPFFNHAREDRHTPVKLAAKLEKARTTDPQLKSLNARVSHLKKRKTLLETPRHDHLKRVTDPHASQLAQPKPPVMTISDYLQNLPGIKEVEAELAEAEIAIRLRTEALCGELAHPDAKPPVTARPGEGAGDVCVNERTDLREGTEEMRLLLAYLYPQDSERWGARRKMKLVYPKAYAPGTVFPHTLWVPHDQQHSDSPHVRLVTVRDVRMVHAPRTTVAGVYDTDDDVLPEPVAKADSFLKQHTSDHAVEQLPAAAIELFDDYVHDSRSGFRVPHFREYAPGGYCWPRVVFIGHDVRTPWLGFDPLSIVLDTSNAQDTALA